MTLLQLISLGYFVSLAIATSLNYLPLPGIIDDQGRAFGVFALDLFDDTLHAASAIWALTATITSHRASQIFLTYFGSAYLADAVLGLITGSGFLDLGIIIYGFYDYPNFFIKMAANAPHFLLGGFAVFAVVRWRNRV